MMGGEVVGSTIIAGATARPDPGSRGTGVCY